MVEVRRYVARDIRSAERQLESDRFRFAAQGLRPTWRVWLEGEASGRSDGCGELIVCFDPPAEERPTQSGLSADVRESVLGLVVDMRELLRLYRATLRELEREEKGGAGRARARSANPRLRRIEELLREVEARLDALQQLPR